MLPLTIFNHHRDPFDRILIAQAIAENAFLISIDSAFAPYSVTTIW
jgi:PIN domain nuclease of toxin-antitoxin system